MLSSLRSLVPASAALLCAPAAAAQTVLHHFDGNDAFGEYGRSVDGGGDVDGDGHADLLLGAPLEGNQRGRVEVRSGLDGSVLYERLGPAAETGFGATVAFVGDVDADGLDDFAVTGGMKVRVYSGADGTRIHTFDDGEGTSYYGQSILGPGDVDLDGYADVLVGAPGKYDKGSPAGWVYVYSGLTGALLRTHVGQSKSSLGHALADVGDLDGDGAADYAASAPYHDVVGKKEAGALRVWSGLDGGLLFSVFGDAADDHLGWTLSGAGDVNGDGLGDLLAGVVEDLAAKHYRVQLFSGAGGAPLHTLAEPGLFTFGGYALDGAGDVNGDGLDDVLVAAPGEALPDLWTGAVYVYSGADGRRLTKLAGASGEDAFGIAVAGAGDVDADGVDDFVVGAYRDDTTGVQLGSATVFGGVDASFGDPYCTPAVPNSTGLAAAILASGSAIVADDDLTLTAVRLPAGKAGYFLASQSAGLTMPPGSMGNLCLGGTIGRFADQVQVAGPGGAFWIAVDLTDLPSPLPPAVQPGDTYRFQCWYRDFVGGPTSNFTDGVRVTFQ